MENENKSQEEDNELDFDPYKILNLSPDSSHKEIKERYYHYSKIFHPDK